MSRSPTIAPPDLWARLASLGDTAHVSVHSLYIEGARQWEVIIRERGSGRGDSVRAQSRVLTDALAEAIAEAERRGWAS